MEEVKQWEVEGFMIMWNYLGALLLNRKGIMVKGQRNHRLLSLKSSIPLHHQLAFQLQLLKLQRHHALLFLPLGSPISLLPWIDYTTSTHLGGAIAVCSTIFGKRTIIAHVFAIDIPEVALAA